MKNRRKKVLQASSIESVKIPTTAGDSYGIAETSPTAVCASPPLPPVIPVEPEAVGAVNKFVAKDTSMPATQFDDRSVIVDRLDYHGDRKLPYFDFVLASGLMFTILIIAGIF